MEHKSPSLPANGSPSLAWGSPALRPAASFPPAGMPTAANVMTPPPHRPLGSRGSRSFGPVTRMGSGSPHLAPPFPGFQTPQHQQACRSPGTPRAPWSDNRGIRPRQRYPENMRSGESPRDSPSVNPGGSDDIRKYYHPSMLMDPWINTPPKPVDFWK